MLKRPFGALVAFLAFGFAWLTASKPYEIFPKNDVFEDMLRDAIKRHSNTLCVLDLRFLHRNWLIATLGTRLGLPLTIAV